MSNDSQKEKSQDSLGVKDFIIPISIVIAGLLIGLGMYLGSMGSVDRAPAPSPIALKNQPTTSIDDRLVSLAVDAGVNESEFLSCLDDQAMMALVQEDEQDAMETGGQGTPWGVLIGPTGKKYEVSGALPQQSLEQLIAMALAETAPEATEGSELLEKVNPVTAEDHVKGNVDAKVKLIVYTDYDCPFCTRMHTTLNQMIQNYAPGDLVWVYRHFPLDQLHPTARRVAVASECAGKLGGPEAFWTFTDGYMK